MKKVHKCLHPECQHIIVSDYTVCLTCRKKKRAWAKKNKKKVKESGDLWRRNNPDKVKASKKSYRLRHLKRVKRQIRKAYNKNKKKYLYNRYRAWLWEKYKISREQYEKILKKQKGLCAICRSTQLCGRRSTLYADHCHKTEKFRGLICFKCNTMLGMANDSVVVLKRAIKYLRRK